MIAGGGIGGLTLALALARGGIASTVIERTAVIEAVGAGLQLSPNATRILFALGLEHAVRRVAAYPGRADVCDAASGRLLLTNRLGDDAEARWGSPYLTLTRAALQAILLEAVQTSGRVELRLGQTVAAARQGEDRVELRLAGGETLVGDALIGADGLHSAVRAAIMGQTPARFTGQTAWRGVARVGIEGDQRVQVWTGPRHHFVRYPVGEGWVNMVAVVEAARGDVEGWDQAGGAADLAQAFSTWPDAVRATIAAVERPWRSALYDRPPLRQWTWGRISLLGDAAHPMLPFLAQGAAMAIEDAWVVADLLARSDAPAALDTYQRVRLSRTARVQAWASRNATLFHLPSPLATGLFGAARVLDRVRGADAEARLDWLYGWRAPAI